MSSDRLRLLTLVALLVLAPFIAACATEEPAEAPVAEPETEAPVVEEPVTPEPVEEAPAEPEIVGNILLNGEELVWGAVADDNTAYTWTARVQNDTTSNLRITIRFQFLDAVDAVVKSETTTITLAPAASRTINQDGTMTYDESLKVEGYSAEVLDFSVAS